MLDNTKDFIKIFQVSTTIGNLKTGSSEQSHELKRLFFLHKYILLKNLFVCF